MGAANNCDGAFRAMIDYLVTKVKLGGAEIKWIIYHEEMWYFVSTQAQWATTGASVVFRVKAQFLVNNLKNKKAWRAKQVSGKSVEHWPSSPINPGSNLMVGEAWHPQWGMLANIDKAAEEAVMVMQAEMRIETLFVTDASNQGTSQESALRKLKSTEQRCRNKKQHNHWQLSHQSQIYQDDRKCGCSHWCQWMLQGKQQRGWSVWPQCSGKCIVARSSSKGQQRDCFMFRLNKQQCQELMCISDMEWVLLDQQSMKFLTDVHTVNVWILTLVPLSSIKWGTFKTMVEYTMTQI